MMNLAVKLMGVNTKDDRMKAAKILVENTHNSICMLNAKDHEPVFVLRAKDPVARVALKAWIDTARSEKLHGDKLSDAEECLKEFMEFQP